MSSLQQQASAALQDHLFAISIVAALVVAGLAWLYLGWRKYKKADRADNAARVRGTDDKET